MTKISTKVLIAAGFAAAITLSAGAALAEGTRTQTLTKMIYVVPDNMGLIGPVLKHHHSFLPSSFVAKPGRPIRWYLSTMTTCRIVSPRPGYVRT